MQLQSETSNWMGVNFFQQVMRKANHDDKLVVHSATVTSGSKPEEHLSNLIYSVNVEYSGRGHNHTQIALIVKASLKGQEDNQKFVSELKMYTQTMGDIQRLLNDEEIAPRLLFSAKSPTNILVLKDLSADGYSVCKSLLGLEATTLVMQNLAKWHAVSYQIGQTGEGIKHYSTYEKSDSDLLRFLANGFSVLAKEVSNWTGDNEVLANKVEKFGKNLADKHQCLHAMNPSEIYVLNHGDFGIKNLMVKLEGNSMKDIRFIDFQMCHWGTPAIDLLSTLYRVASPETRNNHRQELVLVYYHKFVSTLKEVGFLGVIPTLLELQVELLTFGYWEPMLMVSLLPLSYTTKSHDSAVKSGLGGGDDFRKQVFNSPEFKPHLQKALTKMAQKGFLA